jgi:CDP-diglyceride synthetase
LLLSHSVFVNEKWIRFLGVLGLLLFFEFINLYVHPYISEATHESPLYMLLIMVVIASLLIPFHHRIERWIKEKMVAKNKRRRLAAAKKTVARLEKEEGS